MRNSATDNYGLSCLTVPYWNFHNYSGRAPLNWCLIVQRQMIELCSGLTEILRSQSGDPLVDGLRVLIEIPFHH